MGEPSSCIPPGPTPPAPAPTSPHQCRFPLQQGFTLPDPDNYHCSRVLPFCPHLPPAVTALFTQIPPPPPPLCPNEPPKLTKAAGFCAFPTHPADLLLSNTNSLVTRSWAVLYDALSMAVAALMSGLRMAKLAGLTIKVWDGPDMRRLVPATAVSA